jgi:hypothetical protein
VYADPVKAEEEEEVQSTEGQNGETTVQEPMLQNGVRGKARLGLRARAINDAAQPTADLVRLTPFLRLAQVGVSGFGVVG